MKYPQLMRMPSEVSEWLEEQLEQRGIDAIVYTRYVLSLLLYSSGSGGGSSYSDADHLWTWQGMRRRSGSTRNISVAEAERQRRLAAVNCLAAASDHPHHIESLVDELCDRLKRVNSNSSTTDVDATDSSILAEAPAPIATNRHDLARRYYAAFPALQGTHQASSSNSNVILLQEKWPLKRHGKEVNLATPPSKHRYTNCGAGSGKRRDSKRADYASAAMKKRQMIFQRPPGIDRNWFITSRLEDWHSHNTTASFSNAPIDNVESIITNSSISTPNGDNYSINDTLALDIVRDILDDSSEMYAPIQQQQHTLYCCSTNHHRHLMSFNSVATYNNNSYSNNKYITSGTNIITSIWSSSETSMDDDIAIGWDRDEGYKAATVQMCLISEENRNDDDGDEDAMIRDEIDGYLDMGCRWSEAVNYENQMLVLRSLELLNHSQEFSSFNEVMPKSDKGKSTESLTYSCTAPPPYGPMNDSTAIDTVEEEDLLHSAKSHFRPISIAPRIYHSHHDVSYKSKKPLYADGTTFYVSCTLDTLSYERSEDGALFLDTDNGRIEYMSVVKEDSDGEDFQLKFSVRRNDKACQTDGDGEELVEDATTAIATGSSAEEFFFPGDLELLMDEEVDGDEPDNEYVRSEDNCIMEELFGKFIETEKCDKCSTNSNASFPIPAHNNNMFISSSSATNQLKNIWDAAELCVACLRLNAHSSGNGSNGGSDLIMDDSKRKENNQQQEELRYDVTKDGEQLLSDLSSIQNRYMMDEERLSAAGFYYGTGIRNKVLHMNSKNYDYPNDLTTVANTADCLHQQNNHLHHHPVLHSASFSFASRLQEDCLIKMATMPTLRSVTL